MISTTLEHAHGSLQQAPPIAPDRAGAGLSPEQFDRLYADARRGAGELPWRRDGAHPALIAWLNAEAPCLLRPGSRVAVVGCGLGDNTAELLGRGFEVTAFDCADEAIAWAGDRFPEFRSSFVCADARQPPSRWRHRFDLVVDVDTLPWLTDADRALVAAGAAELLHPRGLLLVIARGARDAQPAGVGLSPEPLDALMQRHGLTLARAFDDFEDDANPPVRWLRGVYRRTG